MALASSKGAVELLHATGFVLRRLSCTSSNSRCPASLAPFAPELPPAALQRKLNAALRAGVCVCVGRRAHVRVCACMRACACARVSVCVCARVRTRLRACARACVRACARVPVRVSVCERACVRAHVCASARVGLWPCGRARAWG